MFCLGYKKKKKRKKGNRKEKGWHVRAEGMGKVWHVGIV